MIKPIKAEPILMNLRNICRSTLSTTAPIGIPIKKKGARRAAEANPTIKEEFVSSSTNHAIATISIHIAIDPKTSEIQTKRKSDELKAPAIIAYLDV